MSKKDFFSRVAHNYDRFAREFNFKNLTEYIPLNDQSLVVDLGGGTGRIAKEIEDLVNECIILDLSYEMLKQAKPKSSAFNLLQGSSDELPLKSNSLNQIFINNSLHHMANYKETLIDCHRSLELNGKLIIRDFDKGYFGNIFLRFFEFIMGLKCKFFTIKELTKLCVEIGFSVSVKKPNRSTFILIATK